MTEEIKKHVRKPPKPTFEQLPKAEQEKLLASESKLTTKEVFAYLNNYKNSIYGSGNDIHLNISHHGDSIQLEVSDFLGKRWSHSNMTFNNWYTFEQFLIENNRVNKQE